jgi:hypothetical protein
MLRSAIVVAATLLACSPHHELPERASSLLDTGVVDTGPSYPEGPYGANEGDLVPDLAFEGYRAYSDVWEQFALDDFYDPTGEKGIKYLLVISAAAWCPGCQSAASALSPLYAGYHERGVRIIHLMRESLTTAPATKETVDLWRDKYRITFDNALDAKQLSFSLQPPALRMTPYMLLVDARTMRIRKIQVYVKTQFGQPPTVPALDAALAAEGI